MTPAPLQAVARFRPVPDAELPDVCCDVLYVRGRSLLCGPLTRARESPYVGEDALPNTRIQCYFFRMKNVTITLDEKTAAWARKHAAERGMSLSRFISEVLQKGMRRARDYERARSLFFSKRPVSLKAAGEAYPSRDTLYDRPRLR